MGYTLGTWFFEVDPHPQYGPGFHIGSKESDHTVGRVYEEADARLVAAAPDLLEALEDLVYQLTRIGIPDWSGAEGLCLDQAWAAIFKATGEIEGD